ncbi:MAG: hypothetical protein KF709_02865 [Gemmatimonadaceae bacterium]|nr:hypothetical protein [Gemmatimonadaceae bacterium]
MNRAVRRLRVRRAIPALLAWVSLVLLPTRVLADCPMLSAEATPAQAPAPVAESHDHAAHAAHAAHAEQTPAEVGGAGEAAIPSAPDGSSHHAPVHGSCPDIAHCAVAALAAAPPRPLSPGLGPISDLRLEPTAPAAPALAIDTPPPRD